MFLLSLCQSTVAYKWTDRPSLPRFARFIAILDEIYTIPNQRVFQAKLSQACCRSRLCCCHSCLLNTRCARWIMIQKCQDRTFTRKTALKCHDMAPAIKLQCSNQNLDSSIAASNPLHALNDNERNWSKSVRLKWCSLSNGKLIWPQRLSKTSKSETKLLWFSDCWQKVASFGISNAGCVARAERAKKRGAKPNCPIWPIGGVKARGVAFWSQLKNVKEMQMKSNLNQIETCVINLDDIITVQSGPEIGVLLGSHFAGVPSATESQSSITCWSHEWTYCMYFFQCVQPWCCASLLRHSPTRKDCIRPAGAGTARMR